MPRTSRRLTFSAPGHQARGRILDAAKARDTSELWSVIDPNCLQRSSRMRVQMPTKSAPSSTQSRTGLLVRVLLLGAGLGLTAFLGDYVAGDTGQFLTVVFSGAAWGCCALVAGYFAVAWTRAAVTGAAALVVATLVYYTLILVISRRWQGGVTEDGGSADLAGLASIARATAFWLAASICGGALLGVLGHLARTGDTFLSALCAGTGWALLAGQGLYLLLFAPGWLIADMFGHFLFFSAVFNVVLASVVVCTLYARRAARRSWPVVAAAAFGVSVVSVALWGVVEGVRTSAL
ncbi:hypothetical protein [Dactylosporangium sp. NPDC051484]|uniref:hypothetical protein n=1 Tax=Dactylosporangium sp. NPDC051484 TaxID=3154942 RepID=UPI00344C8C5D